MGAAGAVAAGAAADFRFLFRWLDWVDSVAEEVVAGAGVEVGVEAVAAGSEVLEEEEDSVVVAADRAGNTPQFVNRGL